MRNFKKIVLLFFLLFIFEQVFGFALEPVTYQHYLELELKRKLSEDQQPDMTFIGNSRIASCFIPSVFSNNMEDVECAFNAGTGSQGIVGTYYYLKDILNQYDLKYVVVGLDYQTFLREDRVLKRDLVVLERINSPIIKAEFILDAFQPSEYIYFLKSYQYRGNIWDIPANLKEKLSKEYRQGVYTGGGMVYENLGFARETEVFGNGAGIYISEPWVEENIDWEKVKYLDKILELCKEKDTQVFLVSTPLTISTVYGTLGYNECNQFFVQYAESKGIPYDNLNLLKNRADILPDQKMSSMEHVGADGADIVSEYYCEILNKRLLGEEVDSYFYVSIDEMKENMEDIAACSLHTEKLDDAGNRKIVAESLHKENAEMEYQFEVIKGDTKSVLQPYSKNEECNLSVETISFPMTLCVRCRSLNDHSEKIYEITIDENTWS